MKKGLFVFWALPALLAATALAPCRVQAADSAPGASVSLELNKLEPHDKGCRAYIVVDNPTTAAFQSFFKRISAGPAQDADESFVAGLMQVLRALLLLVFLAWIAGTIWLCKVVWDDANDSDRSRIAARA